MKRKEITKQYENMIDDIEDEEVKTNDEEIEKQEADYLPNYKPADMIDEFNDMCRRESIWYV